MNTRLILVRHGETQWNKENVFRGLSDVPLNEHGVRQAEALGRFFEGVDFAAIYTSRLKRALDTARAIARAQKSERIIRNDEGLLDIHRGQWEGLRHEEAKAKFPELYEKWFSSPENVTFPGGENLGTVGMRAMRSIDRISREYSGKTVILVTHHVVLRVILCGLLDVGVSHFRRFEAFPASVSEVEQQYGKWVLMKLNDQTPSLRGTHG